MNRIEYTMNLTAHTHTPLVELSNEHDGGVNVEHCVTVTQCNEFVREEKKFVQSESENIKHRKHRIASH